MKLSLPISHLQLPIAERQLAAEPSPPPRSAHHVSRNTQHATRNTPHSGVALVITLVLLSIITFMAVTFLVVSRSQHGSVVIETDMANARLTADSARERAIADLLAPIQAGTNEFNYGLRVSANYINQDGFTPTVNSPLNVNYAHKVGGGPIPSALEWERNIANLLYDPRPPVFITNRLFANSNEFRFYFDLNRNGGYDPSGLQPEINPLGGYYDLTGKPIDQPKPFNTLSNFFVGDPEWIGVLRHPEFAHSADNPFVARYAYYVVPAGQTLDINCIHNQALRPAKTRLDPQGGDFMRNQGVGSFEINLGAFLYDLNTNLYAWGGLYSYDPIGGFPARGNAFADAGALLAYRYAMNPLNSTFTLASVSQLFSNGVSVFGNDFVDGYSGGPAMVGTRWPQPNLPDGDSSRVTTPWAGADNPNHFYSTQDLFDKSKTALGLPPNQYSFTDRLLAVGTNNSTYDRYTLYRLLSQLGTDSPPEPGGKMNLNYRNVDDSGYVVPNMATNFRAWEPARFFTNAAIRLLADAGYTVGAPYSTSNLLVLGSNNVNGIYIPITNLHIPIWPTNYYTPSVHRLLQLAANMYDSTTNQTFKQPTATNGFPTVFRPLIRQITQSPANQYVIVAYREVLDATLAQPNAPVPAELPSTSIPFLGKPFGADRIEPMVYGVPLVIGAKKGFPNFNKLAMQTLVQVTRKLQFHRPGTSTTDPVNEIDQMFVVGISNVLGVEAWNSYATAYPRNIELVVWPDISVLVTNLETHKWLNAPPVLSRWLLPSAMTTNIAANLWPGYDPAHPQPSNFQVPLLMNLWFLSNMTYQAASDQFVPLTGAFERNIGTTNFHVPHWKLKLKPRLRFALVDTSVNRIVDYVNLASDTDLDITDALTTGGGCGTPYTPDGGNGSMWCTNRLNGGTDPSIPTFGIQNQLEASQGHIAVDWNSSTHEFPSGMDKDAAIAFFKGQFQPGYLRSSNTFSTPYQPFRNVFLITSWQANDPLVHYTAGDLNDPLQPSVAVDTIQDPPIANLGAVNHRYEPWGGNPSGRSSSPVKLVMAVKDPLMDRSDNWDFPTNKFPNVGWLGRIHRGTPWQTVYLKPGGIGLQAWTNWTGNSLWITNSGQLSTNILPLYVSRAYYPGTRIEIGTGPDANITMPTNDWHLLDLFTTALNDNATRGQLSVNQTNLAAWSAVLSGVNVLTNNLNASGTPVLDASGNPVPAWLPIQPAGPYNASDPTTWPPIARLVNAINIARYKNNPRHVFSRLGDILAVPELTVASPFLNTNNLPSLRNSGLNDAAYERLPQQIAGLLKADSVPRFVIYAFGQTLKPESTRAIVKSGPFAGLCTNYQIVAEAATRTVIRFDGVQPNRGANPPAITNLHPIIESFNVLPPD